MPSAIVIGGGPAGSTASVLLARGGWRVTLVEQHRFPRDKVCGECVSALGADVFHRLRLLDDIQRVGAVRLDRTILHAPSGTPVETRLPHPMWGISRAALDALLLDAANHAGTRVVQPVRCEKVEPGQTPAVHLRDLVANRVDRLTADVVLVADGKSALLNATPPQTTGDFGIKTHFEDVDGSRDAIELFGLDGCYGGLAPIEGGRWNAAFSVPAARVRRHGASLRRRGASLALLFAELMDENPALRRRLAGARQVGQWLAAPLPRFAVRHKWPTGVIPIGNAAAAIEPIGGEGMGLAMRSAEVAAADLLGGADVASLRDKYVRLWRVRSRACRAGGIIASSKRCSLAVARLLELFPMPLRVGMSLMGK